MGLNFGGPAVLGLRPVRPVTLASPSFDGFAFAKISFEGQLIKLAAFSKTSLPSVPFGLRSPASRRRQKIYRVHDRHGLYALLRAKIDRLDAVHYLSDEIRRIHVCRLQLAH